MKKRGTISRCCCGDGDGTGPCSDACAFNFNGCAFGLSGQLYETELDAFNNCGWFKDLGQDLISGQDGNFYFAYERDRTVRVAKKMAFDYRVTTAFTFSYTSELINTSGSLGQLVGQVLDFTFSHISLGTVRTTAGNVSTGLFFGPPFDLSLDVTIGETIRTRQDTFSFNLPDGSIQTLDSCIETKAVTYEATVGDTVLPPITINRDFVGKYCVLEVKFSRLNFGDAEITNASLA